MKKRRWVVVGLTLAMLLGTVGCGAEKEEPVNESEGEVSAAVDGDTSAEEVRIIRFGTHYDQHYDSDDELEDSVDWINAIDKETDDKTERETNAFNRMVAQMKFDNVSVIEEKYNCKYYWANLTFTGLIESVETSILVGIPDCDIYQLGAENAIPARQYAYCMTCIMPTIYAIHTTLKRVHLIV